MCILGGVGSVTESTPPSGSSVQRLLLQEIRRLSDKVDRIQESQSEGREAMAQLRGEIMAVSLQSTDRTGQVTHVEQQLERVDNRLADLEKTEARRAGIGTAASFLVGGSGAGLMALVQWLSGR